MLTKTGSLIDPAKAAAGLRPADNALLEQAIRSLRSMRRVAKVAAEDAKASNVAASQIMRATGTGTATVRLSEGLEVTATLSTPCSARTFDASKVPANLVAAVTKVVVDTKKWDAAVELGIVPADVIAAVVTPGEPYDNVVLTEHAPAEAG